MYKFAKKNFKHDHVRIIINYIKSLSGEVKIIESKAPFQS